MTKPDRLTGDWRLAIASLRQLSVRAVCWWRGHHDMRATVYGTQGERVELACMTCGWRRVWEQ